MIHTIAGNGSKGFGRDGVLAKNAKLYTPVGIAIGPSEEIYIADADNHRICKIALDGKISTIAGNGSEGLSGDGGLAIDAQLNYPCEIAIGLSGEVYIADSGNHTIRKVARDGKISTIAGNGSEGLSGDGGLAIKAQLCHPEGIAVSLNGEVYVADAYNHRIRKISPDGFISTIAGNGLEGGFSGDGGEATKAQLNHPVSIAVSSNGELYIADSGNHTIRKVSKSGLISTVAGNGFEGGFSGDGVLATNTGLNYPTGIDITSSGEIYIADRGNNRIRKVALNGLISTVAGNGEGGLSGDGGLATNAQLFNPCSTAVDPSGDLYIADTHNNRIRKVVGLGVNSLVRGMALQKYERDHLFGSIVCFRPLLAESAPSFESILSADTLLLLDGNEQAIIQQLIDSLMYGTNLGLDSLEGDNVVDWLFVLGMIEGSEFLEVKNRLLFRFMRQLNSENIAVVLEKLITLKKRDIKNQLVNPMIDYTLGMAALTLKQSPHFATNPIIEKHLVRITPKTSLTKVASITLVEETDSIKIGHISSLFNHRETSDIKILLGERELLCHRTVLSSYSSYFEALFHNNCSFNDLEDGTYRIDCTEFGEELHEMTIKFCYGLFGVCDIGGEMAIPLFKCASFYGVTRLVDYSAAVIEIKTGSYFELVEQLGHYPCEILYKRFVEFAFANLRPLDMTQEELKSLPEQIKEQLLWKCIQEQVRK